MDQCPICGYKDKPTNIMPSNVMNHYVNKNNPKDKCILNSEEVEVTHKSKVEGRPDITYVRADKFVPTKVAQVVPVTNTAPVVTVVTDTKPTTPVDSFGNPIKPKQP